MQSPLVLRAKAATTGNSLHLSLSIPKQCDFGANCASVTDSAFKFKVDPLVLWRCVVFVDQQRSLLIRYNNIQDSAIPKINKRHRTSVEVITCSHRCGNVHELS